MLKALPGIYRDGKVELHQAPPCADGEEVLVVFPERASPTAPLLADKGISPEQAADLRARLRAFEPDWNAPGMEAYDGL